MKAGDLIALATAQSAGSELNLKDIRLLLAELMSCQPLELSLYKDSELEPGLIQHFWDWHARLLNGEPLQYILGKAWFYGLEMEVNPAVLIPRPETEGLVEFALAWLKPDMKVLEIGTGSGAIAIALKQQLPSLDLSATELSAPALEVARRNAAKYNCRINFAQADLFPQGEAGYHLIISNPPYISQVDYDSLESRVRDHEPRAALLAGEDGLHYYRRIFLGAGSYLAPEGMVLVEHGDTQRKDIISLAGELGYACAIAKADLAGRDRYLGFTYNKG